MSPRMWLWSMVLAIAGCDSDALHAPGAPERGAPESVGSAPADTDDSSDGASPAGPENSWWRTDSLPSGLSGTGHQAGDIAHDFVLTDQHGDPVRLYQFYGQVIVLELFVGWCESCQGLTEVGQGLWEALEPDGFVYLSVMIEDEAGNTPAPHDAAEWAARFDLTHPVLADEVGDQEQYVRIGYPTIVVIDRDMTILEPDFWPLDPLAIADLVR